MTDTTRNTPRPGPPVTVNWEGSLLVHHSLAMVNRELLLNLLSDNRFDIRHVPYEPDQFSIDSDPRLTPLGRLKGAPHAASNIHVRHRWPPDFSRPACDKYVLIQPWEYGTLLSDWVEQIANTVDEVWVPSQFVKDSYTRSGVPEGKVVVIPNGIDPHLFFAGQPPAPWVAAEGGDRFRFLFNGGVTIRKGADLLVRAYLNEFKANEPVCLVIKDSQVYGKGLAEKIRAVAANPQAPRIVYANRELSPAELPGLYTACDCYIQPYRAEGYGLPLAEAAACDLPVIATGGGACVDFLDEGDAYFADFSVERFPGKEIDAQPTVGFPYWLVPDIGHLQKLMRHVFEHRDEAKEKGKRLGEKIRAHHTWERASAKAADRMLQLGGAGEPATAQPVTETIASIDTAVGQYRSGDYVEAARTFRRCLLDESSRSAAYEGLGLIAYAQDRLEDSFDFFRHADSISPGVADIVLNWAEAAGKLGRLGELQQPIRQALAQSPGNRDLAKLL